MVSRTTLHCTTGCGVCSTMYVGKVQFHNGAPVSHRTAIHVHDGPHGW